MIIIILKTMGKPLYLVAFSFCLYVKNKYTYKSDIYIMVDKKTLKKRGGNIYER